MRSNWWRELKLRWYMFRWNAKAERMLEEQRRQDRDGTVDR